MTMLTARILRSCHLSSAVAFPIAVQIWPRHLLRSLVDSSSFTGKTVAILFADLVKAFDRVIREFAVGWPHVPRVDKLALLKSVGLSDDRAAAVLAELDCEGPLFKREGMSEHANELLNSLHSGSWFRFGNSSNVIVSICGGRQGCQFGGKLSNSVYALALSDVKAALLDVGIMLHVSGSLGAPVLSSSDHHPATNTTLPTAT